MCSMSRVRTYSTIYIKFAESSLNSDLVGNSVSSENLFLKQRKMFLTLKIVLSRLPTAQIKTLQ